MESDARYYRRRAVEERLAARRAMTEQARAWHAKLAQDFAQRADNSGSLGARIARESPDRLAAAASLIIQV